MERDEEELEYEDRKHEDCKHEWLKKLYLVEVFKQYGMAYGIVLAGILLCYVAVLLTATLIIIITIWITEKICDKVLHLRKTKKASIE
ncbi:MAG: hypothetical protein J6F30_04405 [Cellulosilyticum sp.]|nr:hypothetical protein [Cellulosilyticum sp.]